MNKSSDLMSVFFYAEEPTATPPYDGTWYDDYDEYGMSMCTHIHTHK